MIFLTFGIDSSFSKPTVMLGMAAILAKRSPVKMNTWEVMREICTFDMSIQYWQIYFQKTAETDKYLTDNLADSLTDWIDEWPTDWLTDSLTDCLTDTLSDWLTAWLTALPPTWLAGWLTDWLVGWLTDWMTGWLNDWLTDRLSGWSVARLSDSLTDIPTNPPINRQTDKPTNLLMARLAVCMTGSVTDWLTGQLNGRLNGCFTNLLNGWLITSSINRLVAQPILTENSRQQVEQSLTTGTWHRNSSWHRRDSPSRGDTQSRGVSAVWVWHSRRGPAACLPGGGHPETAKLRSRSSAAGSPAEQRWQHRGRIPGRPA